jgi:pSer/pThr/pTyr-binding forkhead associated (FHA) protein
MRVRGTTVVVPLDVPAVVGRRPGPVRPSEHPAPRRVVIPTEHTDVSSRHARFELVGESLVVTDLGSTNGVVVHWSTGASLRLRSRESCAVLSDTIIVLGDGVEIEFVAMPVSPTFSPSEHP